MIMQKHESIFRRILRIIGILAFVAAGLLLCGWLCFRISLAVTAPKREDFLQYARETYQKEFVFVREFTYSDYTYTDYIDLDKLYGLEKTWPIRWCPAVELEDPGTGISFNVYASPVFGWHFTDSYGREVLLYCANEQGIPFERPWYLPILLLENSRDDALKLQQAIVRFNEIYTVDKTKKYLTDECFTIPGSNHGYRIHSGFYKDPRGPRFEDIFYFCYDTPLETYEAFLKEKVG